MAERYDGLDVHEKIQAFARRNPNAAKYGGFWGRRTRREVFSGSMAVHSTEGLPDRILPDDGAANTVAYFGHSTRPASYHKIVDSDSIEVFLPWSAEAFHDATGGNRYSGGVSMATQAHRWGENPAHDDRMIRNAARAAADGARYWASLAPGRNPLACARWITVDEYRRREPGLIEHGELDPGRRSDPWTKHPFRPELRRRLITYMAEELGKTPEEWDEMASKQELAEVAEEAAALTVMALTGDQFDPKKLREADVFNLRDLEKAMAAGVVAVGVQVIRSIADRITPGAAGAIDDEELAARIADELARRLAA